MVQGRTCSLVFLAHSMVLWKVVQNYLLNIAERLSAQAPPEGMDTDDEEGELVPMPVPVPTPIPSHEPETPMVISPQWNGPKRKAPKWAEPMGPRKRHRHGCALATWAYGCSGC